MNEEKIFKELEEETAELYAEEAEVEVAVPVEPELVQAMKEVYGKEPDLVQTLGILAATSGTASYALIDYSFTSNARYLWTYAGGGWRYRPLNDAQIAGIAKVVMEAYRLDVWWSGSKINFARCWKKF